MPIKKFVKDRRTRTGYLRVCKLCRNKAIALAKNKDPQKAWAINTLKNHKRRGFVIDVDAEKLIEHARTVTHCPVCGRKIEWGGHERNRMLSPSLDRINGDRTIRLDNIQITCVQCNVGKGDGDVESFVSFCKNVVRNND